MPSLPVIEPDVQAKARGKAPEGAFDPRDDSDHAGLAFEYALRLGDDALILGQRLAEWCGHAPSVEVDLSLANIALDLIGQATLFLDHAGALEGKGRDGDRLAFHRDVLDWRNCLMVEQPNGDFAQTMARQFLFSTWHELLLTMLSDSADAQIAAVAAKGVKEVAYHRELAAEWVVRLGDGTADSRARMVAGLDWMWRFIPELFASEEVLAPLLARGVAADPAAFRDEYDRRIVAVMSEAGLDLPPPQRAILGGRQGHHGEHLGHLLAVMQALPRTMPGEKW